MILCKEIATPFWLQRNLRGQEETEASANYYS